MKNSKILLSAILTIFLITFLTAFLTSCVKSTEDKDKYGNGISISPMDSDVKIGRNTIVIKPKETDKVYTLSGYFLGQIVVENKAIIKLDNVFLENQHGKPAIKCKEKTEISTIEDSVNYVISTGRSYSSPAAISAKKDLILGGSGTLLVKGKVCHAVKGRDVKMKGSGKFFIEGTKNNPAIRCENFMVNEGKTFSCFFVNSLQGIKAKQIDIASGNFCDSSTEDSTQLEKED